MSPLARLGAAFLIATLALPAAAADGPHMVAMRPEISSTDNFVWLVALRVHNPLDVGVFTDSLIGQIEDTGRGEIHGERTHRVVLTRVTSHIASISARDSGVVTFECPAVAEQADMRLLLHTHSSDGRFFVDTTVVKVKPGETWRLYRSELIPVGKGKTAEKIETVFIPPQLNRGGPAPGVLLIHGDGTDARRMIPNGWVIANEGYAVMVVSQPGYGRSEGTPDFVGPATMRAVSAALDHLRRMPEVDSNRVVVWGASRGATAAMLLAAHRREVRGVVAESGIYDLWATHRETKDQALADAIVREAGRDSAAWRARSPVMVADSIRVPVCIAHGDQDESTPYGQAKDMAARLKNAGAAVEARFVAGRGHTIASPTLSREYFEFLKRVQSPQ